MGDRLYGGRVVGRRHGAAQLLADSVCDLSGSGLADRWCRRRGVAGPDRCGRNRLVVRFRLFSRRPLLDRLCVPGRCAYFRLASAHRRCRPAGRACDLHRLRGCAGAPVMDARRLAHPRFGGCADRIGMVARTHPDWISVERLRLRSDRAAGAGAERRTHRHLGPHVPRGRDLRQPGDAVRRPQRKPLATAAADAGGGGAHWARRIRHRAARACANPVRRGRAFAHHAAEPPARRALQLCRQATSAGPLHRAVPARGRAGRREPAM